MRGHSFYIKIFHHLDFTAEHLFGAVFSGTAAQESRTAADETLSFRKSQFLPGNFLSSSVQYIKIKKSSQRMVFFRQSKISLDLFRRQIQQIEAFQSCILPVFSALKDLSLFFFHHLPDQSVSYFQKPPCKRKNLYRPRYIQGKTDQRSPL